MDFRSLLKTTEYDFLRSNERLGDRIMLLGLGGSYAYGTNNEDSDVDFRGVTLMMPSDLLGMTEFEQYVDDNTDTVIYGFNKLVKLLLDCNPNTCEMLGLDEDQYLIKSSLGQELIDNSKMFLSKRVIKSFGGYADAQLRRLQNAIARDTLPQSDREKHILKSFGSDGKGRKTCRCHYPEYRRSPSESRKRKRSGNPWNHMEKPLYFLRERI